MIGRITIVAAAISLSYLTPPSVMNAYNPNGNVRFKRVLTTSSGHRKTFHERMEYSKVIVTMAGFTMGP